MIWTTERIREEMKRLDRITGLKGADLPIEFGHAKSTLGCYITKDSRPHKFRFSKVYFDAADFSLHAAYDVIRHEYAHYMNHVLYAVPDGPHGEQWKTCCRQIGARPDAYYRSATNQLYLEKEKRAAIEKEHCDAFLKTVAVGALIQHPKYGTGTLLSIEHVDRDVRLDVHFPSGERKYISARWLIEVNSRRAS